MSDTFPPAKVGQALLLKANLTITSDSSLAVFCSDHPPTLYLPFIRHLSILSLQIY